MVSELVIEKIYESLKSSDIVSLKIFNDDKSFFYKGYFIKIDVNENKVSFRDVIKDKIIFNLDDIQEIVTIQKGGKQFTDSENE